MLYEAQRGDFSLALAGDGMLNRRLSVFREPKFLELVELVRSADAAIINLEQIYHHHEMSWAKEHSPTFQVGDPEMLAELKWFGFDLLGTATNHAYDFGEAGFIKTLEHIKKYGFLQAGGGRNLGEARAPALFDTARGRVAFMSASSTYPPEARAGDGRPDYPGKPGINGLRHKVVNEVPADAFESLKAVRDGLLLNEQEKALANFHPNIYHASGDSSVRLYGQSYEIADDFGIRTHCNAEDLAGIGDWIRGARAVSDFVVYGIHHHESAFSGEYKGGSRIGSAEFIEEFAHECIERGTDVVVGHGSHFLRGIEIYKGKPIFYGLGNFLYHNETVQRVPPPGYSLQGLGHNHTPGDWSVARSGGGKYGFAADEIFYDSVLVVCNYDHNGLREVRLYPVDLGFGCTMSQRGRPMLAEKKVAQKILTWLQEVSAPYGTDIKVDGAVGTIQLQ